MPNSQHTENQPNIPSREAAPVPAISLQDVQRTIQRRGVWMALALVICFVFGILWTLSRPKYYKAVSEIVVPLSGSSQVGSAGEGVPILRDLQGLTRTRSIKTQVRMLQSQDVWRETVSAAHPDTQAFAQDAKVEIANSRDTDVISISVTARDTNAAADLANGIVTSYVARDTQQFRETSKTAISYVENELARVGAELRKARDELAESKRKTGLFVPDEVAIGRVRALASYEAQIKEDEAGLAESRRNIATLKAELYRTEPRIVAEINEVRNPQRAQIEELIGQLEARRADRRQTYVTDSNEIKALDAQIADAKDRLTRQLQTLISGRQMAQNPQATLLQQQYVAAQVRAEGLVTRLQVMRSTRDAARRELTDMTNQERHTTELTSTVTQLENTHQLLNQSYQTLRISEESRLPSMQVVSSATAPKKPISPNVPQSAALFLFLGICFALALGLVMEARDDHVRTLDEIEQITGLPVLSRTPMVVDKPRLAYLENVPFALLESFRILRGNLVFSGVDRDMRVIGVTSPGSGEGKSTTAVNMAVVMATSGKNVVLVDGDLHRPSLCRHLRIAADVGVTNVVTGNAALDQAIRPTQVEGLSLLPAGPLPPNPSDILNSQGMKALISDLAGKYDAVVIDCPPIVGLSDVPIIATLVDGILLVISAKETRRRLLKEALRSLRYAKAPVVGCVFNKVVPRDLNYGRYYYSYGSDADGKRVKHKTSGHLSKETAQLGQDDKGKDA